MTGLRHQSSPATARVRPKGWEQLPGRPLPGRGLMKRRDRGSHRRLPEHSSLQRQLAQLRSDFLKFRAEVAAEQRQFRAEVAPLQRQFWAEVAAEQRQFRAEVAAEQRQFRAEVAPLQRQFRAEVTAEQRKFRAEVAPLQHQFASNVVHQVVSKFVLTRSQPRKRSHDSTYVDDATHAQLEALAGVVEMSVGELEEGLKAMVLPCNAGEHPRDLAALQRMVKDALQVCGERLTDPELAFARRLLVRYPIEEASLLVGDPA